MMQRNERYLDVCMYQLTEVFELGANFTLSCQFQREPKKKKPANRKAHLWRFSITSTDPVSKV